MKCPYCREMESRVIESRCSEDGDAIRRRRECFHCKRRFTTYERIEETPFFVVKRGGNREQFNRDKLITGILKACEKRPVPMEAIEAVVSQIEREVKDKFDREVSSMVVGEKVMDKLRSLDKVAYVRFASVYRQFTDLDKFIETIDQLKRTSSTEEEA